MAASSHTTGEQFACGAALASMSACDEALFDANNPTSVSGEARRWRSGAAAASQASHGHAQTQGGRRQWRGDIQWKDTVRKQSWESPDTWTGGSAIGWWQAGATWRGHADWPQSSTCLGRWHIYCDLDGVLADFARAVYDLLGRHPDDMHREGERSLAFMWGALAQHGSFFSTLPWTSDGWELWSYLCDVEAAGRATVSVLTGVPRGRWAGPQKRRWCREQLGHWVQVDICAAPDKSAWAGRGIILVDDSADRHQASWERRNGTFVLHSSATASISALECLLAGAPPDDVAMHGGTPGLSLMRPAEEFGRQESDPSDESVHVPL